MNVEFWAVPKEIMSLKGLSLEARMVYGILFTRINGDNEAWPGQKYMADALQVSERSIRRYIDELEEARLITVKQQGLKKTNRYSLTGQLGRSRADKGVRSRPATTVRSHSKRTGVREQKKGNSLSLEEQDALGFTLTC